MWTGVITTAIFDLSDNRMLFSCLGVRLLGNYGFVPSSFPQALYRPGDQRVHPPLPLFKKGIVLSSTQAFLVQDVRISISVSSVTTLILLQIAFFVSNEVHDPSLPSVPGHALPTPIQVNRLIPLLVNYPDALGLRVHLTVLLSLNSGFLPWELSQRNLLMNTA